jgi:hypothetical protein
MLGMTNPTNNKAIMAMMKLPAMTLVMNGSAVVGDSKEEDSV